MGVVSGEPDETVNVGSLLLDQVEVWRKLLFLFGLVHVHFSPFKKISLADYRPVRI